MQDVLDRMRSTARWLRAATGEVLGRHRDALARLDGRAALVLTYHRVLPAEDVARRRVEPGMHVAPETFRLHCRWLRDEMRVLPLREVVERITEGRPLPERACALTFDDGWLDNRLHALPSLEAAGLPATVFLVTGRVGTRGAFWPDEVARRLVLLPVAAARERLAALGVAARPRARADDLLDLVLAHCKALPERERDEWLERWRSSTPDPGPAERELLDWDDVEAMARSGVDFESHGHEHRLLGGLAPDEVHSDLARARAVLRERGHGAGALLAYPGGSHDADVVRIAAECGHRAAFTTQSGLASAAAPLLAQPRLGVHEDVSRSRAELHRRMAQAAVRASASSGPRPSIAQARPHSAAP